MIVVFYVYFYHQLYFYIVFPLFSLMTVCLFVFNKRTREGLWDAVVNQFVITVLVEFVLVRRSIETYVIKIIQ